jgi:hypothetical protein
MPLDVPEVNPLVPVVPNQNSTFNDIILNIIQLIPVMGPIVIDKVFSSTEEDLLYRLLKTFEAYFAGGDTPTTTVEFSLAAGVPHIETMVLPADLGAAGVGVVEITLTAIGMTSGDVHLWKKITRFDQAGGIFGFGGVTDSYPEYFSFAAPAYPVTIFGDGVDGYRWRFQHAEPEIIKTKISYKVYYLPQ